jgi:hypothetical protein
MGVGQLVIAESAAARCSLPPCGGELGRGVVVIARGVSTTTTPTPSPSPQGGGEFLFVIASEAKQSRAATKNWIASSLRSSQ